MKFYYSVYKKINKYNNYSLAYFLIQKKNKNNNRKIKIKTKKKK